MYKCIHIYLPRQIAKMQKIMEIEEQQLNSFPEMAKLLELVQPEMHFPELSEKQEAQLGFGAWSFGDPFKAGFRLLGNMAVIALHSKATH